MPHLENEEIDPELLEAEEALRIAEEEMILDQKAKMHRARESLLKAMNEHDQNILDSSLEKVTEQPYSYNTVEETQEPTEKKGFATLEDLSFVRLIDPIHIPSYLVEQIKNRVFLLDKFYDYLKIVVTYQTESGPILNNTVFLYAITNVNLRQVKGFLFMFLDILNNSLVISQFSIDKEYWHKGEAVNFMLSYVKQLMKELSASRIVWLTKNVKACEALGFNRSRETLMTFEGK